MWSALTSWSILTACTAWWSSRVSTNDGQRLGEVFFHQPWENYEVHGPRAYFDEIDRLEVRYKLEWRIPTTPNHSPARKPGPPTEIETLTSLDYIQRIIEFCRDEQISLRIFLTPSHAHQLEISAATGEWSSIEHGKRELVRLLAEDADHHPGEVPFELYDFSGYSSVTTETLPLLSTCTRAPSYGPMPVPST